MNISHHRKRIIQWVTYAPLLFFIVLIAGVILHINVPMDFINPLAGMIIGGIMLALSPILLIWAQQTRQTLYVPVEERVCQNYDEGPYRYSRHPAYVSLFLMLIGFAFLINALLMLIMAMVLGPIFTFIIIPKEEKILKEVCDEQYEDYQKKVRMWF